MDRDGIRAVALAAPGDHRRRPAAARAGRADRPRRAQRAEGRARRRGAAPRRQARQRAARRRRPGGAHRLRPRRLRGRRRRGHPPRADPRARRSTSRRSGPGTASPAGVRPVVARRHALRRRRGPLTVCALHHVCDADRPGDRGPDPATRAGVLKPVLNALLRKDPKARRASPRPSGCCSAPSSGEGRAWTWTLPRPRRSREGPPDRAAQRLRRLLARLRTQLLAPARRGVAVRRRPSARRRRVWSRRAPRRPRPRVMHQGAGAADRVPRQGEGQRGGAAARRRRSLLAQPAARCGARGGRGRRRQRCLRHRPARGRTAAAGSWVSSSC